MPEVSMGSTALSSSSFHPFDEALAQLRGEAPRVDDRHVAAAGDDMLVRPPPFAYERVRRALRNLLLYPHWRFLLDFPESIFTDSGQLTNTTAMSHIPSRRMRHWPATLLDQVWGLRDVSLRPNNLVLAKRSIW